MSNRTKQDIIQEIAKSTGFIRSEIKVVLEQFLSTVSQKIAEGRTIEIRGFGTFSSKERKQKLARNPRTGESILLAKRTVPVFKFSPEIRELLNKNELEVLAEEVISAEIHKNA